jgi:hypothetical protein
MVGGTSFYYVSLAYSVIATVFFLVNIIFLTFVKLHFQLRSMKIYILDMANSGGGDAKKRKIYLLLSITIIQALIIYLLTR